MRLVIDGASNWFDDEVVTSEAIDEYLELHKPLNLSEDEWVIIRKIIQERFYQTMEGELTILSDDDDHEEWFNSSTGLPYDANAEKYTFEILPNISPSKAN